MAHELVSVSHDIKEQDEQKLAFPMFIHIGSLEKLVVFLKESNKLECIHQNKCIRKPGRVRVSLLSVAVYGSLEDN